MNNLLNISSAKVVKISAYSEGVSHNGNPYQVMPIRVEWESSYKDTSGQIVNLTNTAVIKLMGQTAAWAKDNLRVGMQVDIWYHCFGDLRPYANRDGQYREQIDNNNVADFLQISQAEHAPAPMPAPAAPIQ